MFGCHIKIADLLVKPFSVAIKRTLLNSFNKKCLKQQAFENIASNTDVPYRYKYGLSLVYKSVFLFQICLKDNLSAWNNRKMHRNTMF